jgi:probable phosphoglycerate mutase
VQGQVAAPGLTRRGLRQAQRVAARLAGEPVVALWSSDLRRAAHTAAPIGRALGLEVCYDARLRERSLGAAEGGPSALLGPDRLGIDGKRVVDADAAPDGGESVRQLFDRASSFVRRLVASHGDGDLVLVCHGGVLCVVLAWLDGVGPDDMAWPPVANGLAVCRALELPDRAAEPPDGVGVPPTPGAGRDRRCRQEDGEDPA